MSAQGHHRWVSWRFGYYRCAHCGLIWLKNLVSDRAARKACPDAPPNRD